jgi:hypothetical protein
VRRGELTVWLTDEAIAAWHAPATGERGGQPIYSAIAIETALSVRPEGSRVIRVGYRVGVERLDSRVILSAAPIREVPDVDDGKPPPLQPRQAALSK